MNNDSDRTHSVQSISLTVPKMKKRKWGKPKPGESLKMLAAGSLAFAKAYSSVEKLEHELEAEIQRDKAIDPKKGKGIQKLRRKGGKWILNKYVLLFIVVINIIDCALVLGELILDLHHVKKTLTRSEERTALFLDQLQTIYPEQFGNITPPYIDDAYNLILRSKMSWKDSDGKAILCTLSSNQNNISFRVIVNSSIVVTNSSDYADSYAVNRSNKLVSRQYSTNSINFTDFISGNSANNDEPVLKVFGFLFHKISLTICIILVVWVVLKVLCFGKHLLDRKLEVFDSFVILASFVVDLIFIKGLAMYTIHEFVYILAFMLPWRVIRVTNILFITEKAVASILTRTVYRCNPYGQPLPKVALKGYNDTFKGPFYVIFYIFSHNDVSQAAHRNVSVPPRSDLMYLFEICGTVPFIRHPSLDDALRCAGLVVAVKDHEHFRLKLLFTQKKKIEHENKQIRADRDNYKEQVEALKKLCLTEGVDDWKIFQSLARQPIRPGKGAMGSFASLALGFGKSSSFWSVLGTPNLRRGKSMECVDNKIVQDGPLSPKRHSKGRILSFLGSSTEFFRGKIRKGHQTSLDSDPGIAAAYLRYSANIQQNGHAGKRLVRGETIDTVSTDTSLDGTGDKKYHSEDDCDFSRHNTMDSSVFGDLSNDSQASPDLKLKGEQSTSDQECAVVEEQQTNYRKLEASPIIRRPNTLSVDPSMYRSSHVEEDTV